MFPARAGMSPLLVVAPLEVTNVPRASGDEPEWYKDGNRRNLCSPRERG